MAPLVPYLTTKALLFCYFKLFLILTAFSLITAKYIRIVPTVHYYIHIVTMSFQIFYYVFTNLTGGTVDFSGI